MTEEIMKDGIALVEARQMKEKLLVVISPDLREGEKNSSQSWPEGIIGLVAGRIAGRFSKPCFVICKSEGKIKGSGRSIEGFDLGASLEMLKINKDQVTEDDIGFLITPRINAASRMGHPIDAFRLLTASNESEAQLYAKHLDGINNERKGMFHCVGNSQDVLGMEVALLVEWREHAHLVVNRETFLCIQVVGKATAQEFVWLYRSILRRDDMRFNLVCDESRRILSVESSAVSIVITNIKGNIEDTKWKIFSTYPEIWKSMQEERGA
jgi:hypothetical protein